MRPLMNQQISTMTDAEQLKHALFVACFMLTNDRIKARLLSHQLYREAGELIEEKQLERGTKDNVVSIRSLNL